MFGFPSDIIKLISLFLLILAQIPLFLYPFLHTTSKTRPFEYLRLTSLGVVGALVKVSARFLLYLDCDVVTFIYCAERKNFSPKC